MSFKQIPSDVSLGNLALAMISETKLVSSLDDPGHNARAINRWYKPIVSRLLETHHWGIATKRASLVEVANTRSAEWLYAFDAPIDMAFPVGIALASGVSSVNYYRGLGGLLATVYGKPIFQLHNGTIFSNVTGDLEYVSYDIQESDFPAVFADIVVTMLAARLALEIPKDVDLSTELEKKATTAINLAITNNLNMGGHQYGLGPSEAELARGALTGPGWDYFPRSPGA